MKETNPLRIAGNLIYNNITQIPFSAIKGLAWLHCLPSQASYLLSLNQSRFAEHFSGEGGGNFWEIDYEGMKNSESEENKLLYSHFYGKIMRLGNNLIRGKSELEEDLTVIPQGFVSLISGCLAISGYITACREYGPKALLPLAATWGLSVMHEVYFHAKDAKICSGQNSK